MLRVNVPGGAGSGTKLPLREKPGPWLCAGCGTEQKYARCLTTGCNRRRD